MNMNGSGWYEAVRKMLHASGAFDGLMIEQAYRFRAFRCIEQMLI